MRAIIIWSVNSFGSTCVYFVLALWGFVFVAQTTAQSGYETYVTYRTATRSVSNVNSREECSGWWIFEDCDTVYYLEYALGYTIQSVTSTRCQSGWRSYPNCIDINECEEGSSGCTQNCSNTPGSYTCGCNAGYRLASDGRSCNDIPDCEERSSGCTQICSNTVGSYTCGCYAGYRLASDGRSCNDIDECQEGTSDCAERCSNTVGSYTCGCHEGYRLAPNGISCQDIDECAEGRSGCAQNCSNTIGSYSCSCNASYRLSADERSCNDIDECAAQLDNCTLLESFTCENTIGGYQCVCKTGFEQVEPRECRDINECETLTNNCTLYENTTCENIIGSYRCESDGNRMSESTVTLIIVVTVCAVVGVVLVIIAIVCIVICAKKRKSNKVDKRLSNAALPAGNIYDDIKLTSSSTSSESSNQVIGGYKNMAVTTTPEYKHTPVATTPAASESCSGKADSKETEIGQSTSVNINKNLKELLKAKKAKVDCKDGKATNASVYQDLAAATEKKNIYEAIKNPSKSTHISVQGDTSNDSSHT